MKKSSLHTTVSTILSCVIGAGFVSGKEIAIFFENSIWGAILFALALTLALITLSNFCNKNNVTSIVDFSQKTFGKGGYVYLWFVSLAMFFVVVALFSTTKDCITSLVGCNTKLPLYQGVIAVLCFFVAKVGKHAIEKTTKILLPICLIFIVLAHVFTTKSVVTTSQFNVKGSLIYCFFNFVPLTCLLSKNKATKPSVVVAVVTLGAVVLLQIVTTSANSQANLPTLVAVSSSKLLTIFGIVAILVSAITGILLCSMPVWEFLDHLLCDTSTCIGVTFALAVALSNFGFGKIVELCYPLIATLGFATLVGVVTKGLKLMKIKRRMGKVTLAHPEK